MSIRSGIDDKYDIGVFNSDAWKIAFEYVTKQYVDDNFAGLYSSNLFRGFNYFQNGVTWQAGSLQNDGSILLVDASGNTITINKSKFDTIDASLNNLELNKASKQDITDAINNLIDGSPQALDTLKEISTALNNDPSFATTIINQLATKASTDYVDEADANLQGKINQAQTTLQTNINTVQTNLTNTQTNLQSQITSLNNNKAEKNYVDQVDTSLQTQINSINTSKADLNHVNQADTALQGNLNAVQSNLQTQITSLSSLKANITYVDQVDTTLQANINTVQSNLQTQITSLSSLKANISYVDQSDATLQSNLNTAQATLQSNINLKANIFNPVFTNNLTIQGNLNLAGNLNMNFSDVFARSVALSNTLFASNVNTQALTVNGNAAISGNLNTSSDIYANNLYISKSASFANTASFIPNVVIDLSFPKTLGTSNIYGGYISVAQFERRITFTMPISVYRQYRNISTDIRFNNIIEDTLNSVSFVIQKNGAFYSSGTCTSTDTLPKMIRMASTSSTSSRNYEVYMTNVVFSFDPAYETTTGIYAIYLTPNYTINIPTQNANIVTENFGYFSNTNQTGTTTSLSVGTAGSNYSSTSYQLSHTGIYADGTGYVKLNTMSANIIDVQNSINSNTISCATFSSNVASIGTANIVSATFTGGVKLNNGLAGYHIDGTANFLPTPIFCSLKSFGRANTDNFWYINAGFRIDIFNGNDYVSFLRTMDNTNGTTAVLYSLTDAERDRTDSFRVYYLNVEVSYPPLS